MFSNVFSTGLAGGPFQKVSPVLTGVISSSLCLCTLKFDSFPVYIFQLSAFVPITDKCSGSVWASMFTLERGGGGTQNLSSCLTVLKVFLKFVCIRLFFI